MKDEKERMQEYLKDYTNAHSDLPKATGVDKIVHRINISLSTLMIIVTIIIILMLIPILGFVYSKTEVFFRMSKKDFIKKIEKTYGQKIEIVEDNSTIKGNGTLVLKTKKEPYITFNAAKQSEQFGESYYLDFEERAFVYYLKNSQDSIFDGITVDEEKKEISSNYPDFQFLTCNIYLNIESYNQIEEACRQRQEIQKWMKKKIKNFDIEIHLKIGDFVSYLWSYDELDTLIYKEKYQYYWYLKDNGKDTSQIPQEDLLEIDKPQNLDIYINGERIIDKEQTQLNKLNANMNGKDDYEISYASAKYNTEKKEYEIFSKSIILSCNQFTVLDSNTNQEFSFSYQGKTYGMHYKDDKIHNNKLPYLSKPDYFEQLLGIKIEYDYDNRKINMQF